MGVGLCNASSDPDLSHAFMSSAHSFNRLPYRGLPVNLWFMDTQQLLGACSKAPSKRADSFGINAVVFYPNPEIRFLAVAYWDGELAVYDTKHREINHSIASDAQKLAVSPDGKTLVGGSTAGKFQLYDFETLQLLHDITLAGDSVAALAFTSDNLRFLDLQGSQANVSGIICADPQRLR